MRLENLPNDHYFVVIAPNMSSKFLAKDSMGQIRTLDGWQLFKSAIIPNTEVQPIHIKESGDHV